MIVVVYAGSKRNLALLQTARQKLYRFVGKDVKILKDVYYVARGLTDGLVVSAPFSRVVCFT